MLESSLGIIAGMNDKHFYLYPQLSFYVSNKQKEKKDERKIGFWVIEFRVFIADMMMKH